MAANFRIASYRNAAGVHVLPKGDFDGSSAMELIDRLGQLERTPKTVVIHTDHLTSCDPFGLHLWRVRLWQARAKISRIHYRGRWAKAFFAHTARSIHANRNLREYAT